MNFEDARRMSMNKEHFKSHHTFMPSIMLIFVYISYVIMNVYVFTLIQTKGKAILVFVFEMDINIDNRIEKNIAIKAIILQITATLIGSLPFYLCDILLNRI